MKQDLASYYTKLIKLNLKRLKKEKNWTITKMALTLGLSEGYLGHLLSLKSNKTPSITILAHICEKTNIPITYFFEEFSNTSKKD